ncbi:ankyrin repeat domain-containing protein [Myxococcus stipitatus]|uniref:ankyrin repeat domain-containing protein n=1 Tax=Myxococcus stipitatus TaxID=83455 RepID=UPI001F1DA280|nr:ankyrin repeat domain-containing protein [Myxococcus stipitatus]MCE9668404.1 ankyrin repeat domain-containing protein [Myxococcus stipitatus]
MSNALLEAIFSGDVAAVRTLATSADAQTKDGFGRPPLSVAASRAGDVPVEVLSALIDAGHPVDAVQGDEDADEVGWTALHHACLRGTFPAALGAVRELLARGANPEGGGQDRGITPLMLALSAHHLGIAEALLKAGANPNTPVAGGNPPLHHVVALFKQRKDGGYEEDEREAMATDAVTLLLAHGADASGRDKDGETALAKALIGHLPAELVLALVDAGAPLDERVKLGDDKQPIFFTPVAMAIGLKQPDEVLSRMLARGFDASKLTEHEGQSLLHYAAMKRFSSLKVILKHQPGLDLNARDESGATPLFLAAWKDLEASVLHLLELGVDPNLPDAGGNAPLHTAARNGFDAVVEHLLAKGADRTLRNAHGETAADRARKAGHVDLATKLA